MHTTITREALWTLEAVLRPLPPSRFLEEHWERQTCTVTGRGCEYYAPLLSIRELDAVIASTPASNPPRVRLVRSDHGRMAARPVPYSADGMANMYVLYRSYVDEGYTITIDRLDLSWAPIAKLCRNLEDLLQHPVAANAYYTPPMSQGFLPHYDTHDVFVLQIEGSKTWRLYDHPAGLPFHDETSTVDVDGIGPPRETVRLEAGDMLYIPRGHVHDALTTDDRSLHVTVGVHVFRWADLIAETVSAAAAQDPRWREAVPVGAGRDQSVAVQAGLRDLLLRLADSAEHLGGHERLARRLLANGHPLADGHFGVLDMLTELNQRSVVSRREGLSCKLLREPDRVTVHFGGNIIAGPPELEDALAFIVAHEQFAVADIPDSLDVSDKLALARRFIREGLLTFRRAE